MATQNVGQVITGIAGADLSTAQYKFVKLAADGEYDLSSDGAQAEGVAQNDPAAQGRALAVATAGIVKVVVGTGGLTAGDDVASGAAGVAITAASGDAILMKIDERLLNQQKDKLKSIIRQTLQNAMIGATEIVIRFPFFLWFCFLGGFDLLVIINERYL